MDELVAWLTACLDEIERVARATPGAPDWVADGHNVVKGGEEAFAEYYREDSPHIALHDPRSVLARVEAERAVLRLHKRDDNTVSFDDGSTDGGWVCRNCSPEAGVPYSLYPCETLRLLAYGHRHDASGYDPAWAPEGVSTPTPT